MKVGIPRAMLWYKNEKFWTTFFTEIGVEYVVSPETDRAILTRGEMLSIKPVISVVRGEVKLVGKAMGSKKGNNLLTKLVSDCGGIDFTMPYVLGYSGLSDEFLQKYIRDSEALWKDHTDHVPYYLIGSTIGTHVGPGAIAVAFFAK